MLTIYGIFGKAGNLLQATGEGLSISTCLLSEYATMVRIVEKFSCGIRRSFQRIPECHSLTHTIQLTQNIVTPASKNFVTRSNLRAERDIIISKLGSCQYKSLH